MLLVQASQVLDEQRQPVGKAAQAEPPLLQLLECRHVGLGVVHDDTNQPLRVARGHLHGELHVLLHHPLSVLAHACCVEDLEEDGASIGHQQHGVQAEPLGLPTAIAKTQTLADTAAGTA